MMRILAFILLILSLPFVILAMVVLFITTFESPLFLQERIGKNRTPFTIIKLRTMKNGQVTFVGRVLRKTGIDEIPQLINVVFGSMAIVGPRPLTISDIERLEWNTSNHDVRWSVKPGITGLAQFVTVCDKNASWNADMEYVRDKSSGNDLKIIFYSLLIPIMGKTKGKNKIKRYYERLD
jgi:lipopolysaccharide/colanic/teichoic acid biosynthesis glycosyltransferase